MNKIRIALIIVIFCVVIAGTSCGAAYASWFFTDTVNSSGNNISFTVPDWDFTVDTDLALIGNVDRDNLAYFEVSQELSSQENSKLCGSAEAVRLTNTAGTQTKDHSVIFRFDAITIGEIKTQKISFDYYHEQRREQVGVGFPRVQLLYDNTTVGNMQPKAGNDNVCNELSCFSVTELANGWWHLEYFISALTPTYADHGDRLGYTESTEINGIKIVDKNIYNHHSIDAYCVIDNLRITNQASIKLGLFNNGTSFAAGKYYWMKVAFAGEVHRVEITFSDAGSDDPIAVYTPSALSPFYIKGLRAGTVVATCTMELGDEHQILSISNTLTVT